MWTVAVVPLVVLVVPLCLQLLEARWVDPADRSRALNSIHPKETVSFPEWSPAPIVRAEYQLPGGSARL
jgi:hypothetical protein